MDFSHFLDDSLMVRFYVVALVSFPLLFGCVFWKVLWNRKLCIVDR